MLLGLVLALSGPAVPASAHATLQETDPAADSLVDEVPAALELRFDEPVTATAGAVQVISPEGARVDAGVEAADGDRTVRVGIDGEAIGTYTIAYRVVSDDGHTITGSFVVHAETQTGAASVDQSVPATTSAVGGIGRWLSYAGAVVAVGAALLLALSRRSPGIGAALGPLATLVAVGAAAGALGGVLAVVAQTALTTGRSLTGAVALVPEVAGDSRPVAIALGRAAVVGIGAVVAVVARRRTVGLLAAGGIVAAGGLLAPVAGHPWTADPRALAVPADALHLLAASVWLGLLVALVAAAPRLPDPTRAVRQVSSAALVAALVVAGSGTVSGWLLLGSLDALFRTASGQLVILKVIGFGTLVALGWINRSRLVPLLEAAVSPATDQTRATAPHPALVGGPPGTEADHGGIPSGTGSEAGAAAPDGAGPPALARRRLLQVVRAEVVVGVLVLAVTAGLVNQPPGRDVVAQPFAETVTTDDASLLLEVEPAQAGTNQMHVYLTDTGGQPAPFDAIEVAASRPGIPERKLEVEQISPDHAVVYGASLPTPGTWTVAVTTVREGTPREFTYEVPVR